MLPFLSLQHFRQHNVDNEIDLLILPTVFVLCSRWVIYLLRWNLVCLKGGPWCHSGSIPIPMTSLNLSPLDRFLSLRRYFLSSRLDAISCNSWSMRRLDRWSRCAFHRARLLLCFDHAWTWWTFQGKLTRAGHDREIMSKLFTMRRSAYPQTRPMLMFR